MQNEIKEIRAELDVKKDTPYRTQICAINQQYLATVNNYERQLIDYEKLQISGWRVEHSEVKLSGY